MAVWWLRGCGLPVLADNLNLNLGLFQQYHNRTLKGLPGPSNAKPGRHELLSPRLELTLGLLRMVVSQARNESWIWKSILRSA